MGTSFLLFIYAGLALAGPTFDPQTKDTNIQKAEALVDKALASTDAPNARLRVEGALFRAFNLYLPACELGQGSPKDKYALIREVLEKDLAITGHVSLISHSASNPKLESDALLKQKGAEGISRCQISFKGQKILAVLDHKNLLNNISNRKHLEVDSSQYRRMAHLMAQSIFENYIGPENIFISQIAAVKRHKNYNQVVLFDFDGANETPLSSGSWNKAGPAFSPKGDKIFYTAVTDQGQVIIEQQVSKPNLVYRVKYPGLNLDATPLPDESGILVTLSLGRGDSNIFKTTPAGVLMGKITENMGTNLSPALSPSGDKIAFVSTRGGAWHIYEQSLKLENGAIAQANRLTKDGRFNQTPRYNHKGDLIAFTTKDEKQEMNVAILERESGRVSYVTRNQGVNQEPVFSDSDRFVIFSSERGANRRPGIYLATINGDHQAPLTTNEGYFSPVLRPQQK